MQDKDKMKHEKQVEKFSFNAAFFKVGGCLILFFAMPLLALKSSILESVDNWMDNVTHQVCACVCCLFIVVYFTLIKK
jgi:hypothetical protein